MPPKTIDIEKYHQLAWQRQAEHRKFLATFEKTYLRVDEDDDKVFRFMPCPFLGGDNL